MNGNSSKYSTQCSKAEITAGSRPASKLIYIASPYAGNITANTQFAVRCCQYAIRQGHTPVAPHLLYPQMLDDTDPGQRALGLRLGLRLLVACDELWVFGKHVSSGMASEIAHAKKLRIVTWYIEKLDGGQEDTGS